MTYLFTKAVKKILQGSIDLENDTIKVVPIDTGTWTPDQNASEFYSQASSAAITTPVALGSKTLTEVTGGVEFDAADSTFPTVTGDTAEGLLIYKDTGTESTSPLICWKDDINGTGSGNWTGTPQGADWVFQWGSYIFDISG